jgi:streptogramin lyase
MNVPADIVQSNPDGTVVDEHGRVWRQVIGRNHIGGYRPVEHDTAMAGAAASGLDQLGPSQVPTLGSIGIDQLG